MPLSRRRFFELTAKSVLVIGVGNTLESFSAKGFRLPPAQDIQLRFAIASDGHYGQPDTTFKEFHLEMIDWINREKKQRGVDFTVVNGDLFHDNPAFLPEIKSTLDKLTMPYYVTHGNHDKTDAATWEQTWKIPLHYSFEITDAAFLILNTADDTGNYICPDQEWTRTQLARFASKKQLFVFMHITPVKWTDNAIDCPELVALFENQQNLKAIFHGHDHDQDTAKVKNGKHYLFDAHIGGSWGTSYRGYRIVEVVKDGSILTYQMNPVTEKQVNNNSLV